MRRRGIYVGTLRLQQPWYARMMKHQSFPAKGLGEYWYDYKGFYFVGSESSRGLVIPSETIIRVDTGFRHGTTLSRSKILKIVWRSGAEKVSSGFIVSEADQVRQALTTTGWA